MSTYVGISIANNFKVITPAEHKLYNASVLGQIDLDNVRKGIQNTSPSIAAAESSLKCLLSALQGSVNNTPKDVADGNEVIIQEILNEINELFNPSYDNLDMRFIGVPRKPSTPRPLYWSVVGELYKRQLYTIKKGILWKLKLINTEALQVMRLIVAA